MFRVKTALDSECDVRMIRTFLSYFFEGAFED
jgi:hypothetical protein